MPADDHADDDAADEADAPAEAETEAEGDGHSSQHSYRTQRRGGKGLHDIKTTAAQRPGHRHRPRQGRRRSC